MNYTTEITVDIPRKAFIEKLDSAENMKHWQRGLLGYKLLSGEPGQEGSKMELSYTMGKRNIIMVETIVKRNMPNEFHAIYDTKGVHNVQKNYFEEIGPSTTKWTSESEFQFSGFLMKTIALLMPGSFKKQSLKYMQDFKAFAEKGISVIEN